MLSTVTSKGQITIPVGVRRAAGIETGTQVEFIINTRKRIELVPRHGDIRALRGVVPALDQAVTLDDMDAAISEGWASSNGAAPAVHPPRFDELRRSDKASEASEVNTAGPA